MVWRFFIGFLILSSTLTFWVAVGNSDGYPDFYYRELAEKAMKDHKYSDAISYFLKFIELNPDKDSSLGPDYHELAHAYEKLGRWNDAERAFREALKREPFNGNHNLCMGMMYFNKGDYGQALENFNEAIKKTTGKTGRDHEAYAFKALTLVRMNKHDEAMPAFKEAISLCPDEKTCNLYKKIYNEVKEISDKQKLRIITGKSSWVRDNLYIVWLALVQYIYYILAIFVVIIGSILLKKQYIKYSIKRNIIKEAYATLDAEIKYNNIVINMIEKERIRQAVKKVIEEQIMSIKYHGKLQMQQALQDLIRSFFQKVGSK